MITLCDDALRHHTPLLACRELVESLIMIGNTVNGMFDSSLHSNQRGSVTGVTRGVVRMVLVSYTRDLFCRFSAHPASVVSKAIGNKLAEIQSVFLIASF